MRFSVLRHSRASSIPVLILGFGLSALPSWAQSNSAKPSGPAAPTPPVQGKVVEDIVARVNDQIITQSDYDRASEQLEAEARQQNVSGPEVDQKKKDLLRDLIDKQLLLSKGKELGITGETELIKHLDDLRKQNHLDSMEDLEKAYAAQAQGTSFEDFKASIRDSIITQQVVRDEVGRHITINPAEVQRYYKEHESEFAQPESVTLNEILIPTPAKAGEAVDTDTVAAAQAKADALEAKLAAGAKFADLAKPAPTDPLEPKSVSLGEFHRDQLAKEISDKAFALNAGQHTQPIRTKQGFIILEVTDHNQPGDAGFKKAEPQVEEALFMERMQPALRTYLTKLREEAYVDLKTGVVDTGSTPNELRLSYSAYQPPAPKKKVKFQRARYRGRDRTKRVNVATPPPTETASAAAGSAAATPGAATTAANNTQPAAAPAKPAPKQQASNNTQGIEKPGKKEKIRFGQAPRESLPAAQVATNNAPDNMQSVTTPETRVVNPDGTISGAPAAAPERKTRLSNRPTVKKVKPPKDGAAADQPTADDLASQKVQNAPLGLADQNAAKPKKSGEKTRLSDKPTQQDQSQPYLGKPANPASTTPAPGTPAQTPAQPDGSANPPAPATNPSDPNPPATQQPQP